MDVIDKLNYYLQECGKTGADLSRDLGLSNATYSNWNTKKTKIAKRNLPPIAEWLTNQLGRAITVADLTSQQKENPTAQGDGVDTITEKEVRMLKWFRSLPEEKLRAILISQDAPKDLLD